MSQEKLLPGVVEDPYNKINPNAEAYWIETGDGTWSRVNRTRGDVVVDENVKWVPARMSNYVRLQRTLFQRIMRTEVEDSYVHPDGTEVLQESGASSGYLFSVTSSETDLSQEFEKRVTSNDLVLPVSESKLYFEGSTPRQTLVDGSPLLVEFNETEKGSSTALESIRAVDDLNSNEMSVQEAEEFYRRVFDRISKYVEQDNPHLSAEEIGYMRELDLFRRERMRWARVNPDGGMVALEPGIAGNAWTFIVPPNHFIRKNMKTVFAAHVDNSSINAVLMIVPAKFTDTWAALGAIHELSHLRDTVLKIEPAKGRTRDQYLEGERKAYSVEIALASAFSKNKLQPVLHEFTYDAILTHGPYDFLGEKTMESFVKLREELDLYLEPTPQLSDGELGTRGALYLMMLYFEAAKILSNNDPEKRKFLEKKFIEHVYEPTGHLPKK